MRWAVILLTTLLAGCASLGERSSAAEETARSFLQAVADGDGAAACGALAPETEAEIDAPCEQSILSEALTAPSPVADSRVYGQSALVTFADDAVFLAVFRDGWRVVAAGCTSRGERPYDCRIQGG
ncbi:ketosteroid isomerase-like protein [Actinoplanes campanulatus]|uniref:Ketosteroid isomerase-like protein n=1 Tax=Actinoplanes campanulatus TaxID=113559 RepID=A0A7W5ANC3_9ACTN|nr:hypothetical protein [Actinoplanes campanulatus]MBB3099452.1 ketosteroid isomerase-like protein [Actinoplanes campanulatus]GGN42786.1 hypothetical protein GCM10010109_74290 [Actinoplanes campanulatus]GID39800.1 hypothetical protein Aca09nite_63060 [Actinoplanes campanulatus]